MNRCLQERDVLEYMIKGKTILIQKVSTQRNSRQQLPTNNVPTYDVEKLMARIREEIYNSLISCRLFPRGTERMLQDQSLNVHERHQTACKKQK